MFIKNLGGAFVLKEISREDLWKIQDQHYEKMFANRHTNKPTWVISEEDQKKMQQRHREQQRWEIRFGLYHGDEAIGWHSGYSIDPETFYMQNSAVIESYQKQGLYGKMLGAVLEKLKDEGFQVVTSLHHPNNPGVVIPKLKQGFVITATQFHERFRFLIEMKYFFNEDRRRAYSKEIGLEI